MEKGEIVEALNYMWMIWNYTQVRQNASHMHCEFCGEMNWQNTESILKYEF